MGVTAHFFAFDPAAYSAPPTIDALRERGDIDDALVVARAARERLLSLDSALGDNKKWNANLCGDFAWSRGRRHVAADLRAELDAWFSHLFWEAEGADGCPCGDHPKVVADDEVIFDRRLIEHILGLERSLEPVAPALAREFVGDPPASPRLHRHDWIYDYEGFSWLVDAWMRPLRQAHGRSPGWSVLRWVWV